MNAMLLILYPMLVIATWGAGAVLLERDLYFRRPVPHVITATLLRLPAERGERRRMRAPRRRAAAC